MGILNFRRDDGTSLPIARSDSQSSQDSGVNITSDIDPWLVVVVVIGIVIVTTLAVFMLAHYIKSRHAQREGFQPVEKMSEPYLRRRKRSSDDRQHVGDLERDMMIRKSLASRVSLTASPYHSRTPSSSSSGSHDHDLEHPLDTSEQQGETAGLRDDWKAWEARMMDERRISHPGGLGHDQHPAFAPYLSIPQPTLPARDVAVSRRI
ncbi:hypothetical protein ONZ43_g7721 [Nemania bipapillata]|uniref:Uncharacterized protein n=1 Tax=Nemania bipapillata TaxID=110536 RepID=A0ACC2HP38_9PEZI|nr:hypothetical protein ONZ43_g7721 [Nemania bipapillata]